MNVHDIVAPWIKVASDDIAAIRNNLYGPMPNHESASYHCQQAAEKLIKAALTAAKIRFGKMHHLTRLLELLPAAHPMLEEMKGLDVLSPYVFAFRYPPEHMEIEDDLDVPTQQQLET